MPKLPKTRAILTTAPKRDYLSQENVPGYSLVSALRIPQAIADNYGFKPTPPLLIAQAMSMQPGSSHFRMLCGASIAYGLTLGGYNAPEISITGLGLKIIRPTDDEQKAAGRKEALLKPKIVGEFLRKYDRAPLPRPEIAKNVLLTQGVPKDKLDTVYDLIIEGAIGCGFLREIKDKKYVFLGADAPNEDTALETGDVKAAELEFVPVIPENPPAPAVKTPEIDSSGKSRRVFITHGKNQTFIDPIKKLLGFGEFTPLISVDKATVSQPVPDKVMNDMRSCGASIIHVDAETTIVDKDDKEHIFLNPNVLIEIGASMALYGRRFILLVKEGVKLPSNLQGLFEVRYTDDKLDAKATIALMEAINELKKIPVV